ncbi:MAG: aminopeptidase [Clostridia bacterium]|nr:aminopeptidase [Clostridia bacterium]
MVSKSVLRKYAKVVVKQGVNVQKGQGVIINVSVDQHEFAKYVMEEAYRAGAKWVRIDWSFQEATKLKFRHENLTTLSKVPAWEEEKAKYTVDEMPALIHIVSDDPDGMKGVNVEKYQKTLIARQKVLKKYRDAQDGKNQWTIVAVPSAKWAKKVFPGERTSKAMDMLWDAILATVRVNKDNDPVAEWDVHNENLKFRSKKMTEMNFTKLHYYNGLGTDFTVGLIPNAPWEGGGEENEKGVFYNPNMPTEEVFTSPNRNLADGKVVSTKPLSYQGQLIDNFWVRFENGRAVEWDAEVGADMLDRMITTDEGSHYLGELALIPHNSPISNSGILYYNTLFDENASCHVALGRGFTADPEKIGLTREEQHEMGVNESMIHVDFMIGSADMNIDGYKEDGTVVPVFRNGEWAF